MFRNIVVIMLVVVAVAVLAVVALAAMKPDTLKVERSLTIKAPPEKIFALIDDFKAWRQWSPYEVKDPNMQRTLSGADAGLGAVYEWNGNGNVGQGRMEIVESKPSSRIAIKLDFKKPIEGHNVATFTMEPDGDATKVTWTMEGPSPFIGKVMGVFFDMDKMIGTDFATGLANLKQIAEK